MQIKSREPEFTRRQKGVKAKGGLLPESLRYTQIGMSATIQTQGRGEGSLFQEVSRCVTASSLSTVSFLLLALNQGSQFV